MTIENDLEIKKNVYKLIEAKKWVDAKNYLDNLNQTKHSNYHHISKCATLTLALEDYISIDNVTKRLKVVTNTNQTEDDLDLKVLNIEPILNGRVCIYALKITASIKQSNCVIFEKIFPAHSIKAAENEVDIYESRLISTIKTPKFYGIVKSSDFVSNYYDFIDGNIDKFSFKLSNIIKFRFSIMPLVLSRYKGTYRFSFKILEDVWDNSLYSTDLNFFDFQARRVRNKLNPELFLHAKRFDKFNHLHVAELYKDQIEKVFNFIVQYRETIESALLTMPAILMHEDIDRRNIILDRNMDFYLIDWEKYSFSRVGDGFFRFYNAKPPVFFYLHVWILSKKYNLKFKNLLLSIIVYEVDWAISKNQPKHLRKIANLVNMMVKIIR